MEVAGRLKRILRDDRDRRGAEEDGMTAAGGDETALLGAWRLVARRFEDAETGEPLDAGAPTPNGHAVFEAGGRVMFLVTEAGRAAPKDDAEAAAAFRALVAYTGRFRVSEGRLLVRIDAAWQPSLEGIEQERLIEWQEERLVLRTPEQAHPRAPGRRVRGTFVWVRDLA
jgi:hypothetical protein